MRAFARSTLVALLFGFVLPAEGRTISGSFIATNSDGSYRIGRSPFMDFLFEHVLSDEGYTPVYRPLQVDVAIDYSIDLTTGAGTIQKTAIDNSFIMTFTALPGAFFLEEENEVAAVENSTLLFLSRLESPIGLPVPDSDPIRTSSVLKVSLYFTDATLAHSSGMWDHLMDHDKGLGMWTHMVFFPEPSTLILVGSGIVALGVRVWLSRRQ